MFQKINSPSFKTGLSRPKPFMTSITISVITIKKKICSYVSYRNVLLMFDLSLSQPKRFIIFCHIHSEFSATGNEIIHEVRSHITNDKQ